MEILESTFASVVSLSLRATILIFIFIGMRHLGRRWIPPQILYLGWVVIALRMLVPFSVPISWTPYEAVMRPMGEWAQTIANEVTTPIFASLNISSESQAAPSGLSRGGVEMRNVPGDWTPTRFLAAFWIAGVGGMILVRVVAGYRLRVRLRQGRSENEPRVMALANDEAQMLGLKGSVKVLTSSAIGIPAIMGLFRPRLLLPPGFPEHLTDRELRFVLRHELGHWKRCDPLTQMLMHAALTVHWINPLVWIASLLARRDCELACDEFVMNHTSPTDRRSYGTALLNVMKVVGQPNPFPAKLGIFGTKKKIKQRIDLILHYHSSILRRIVAGVSVIALVCLASITHESSAARDWVEITTEAPTGWFKNGSKKESYVVGVDRSEIHIQPFSAYVKSTELEIAGFGGMMQTFRADNYIEKRVRFSAYVKTSNVIDGASIWMRIDAKGNRMVGFDNMMDRPIKGTSDWTWCSIVLDVPPASDDINFGFFISGTGQAWFNDAKFEVVDLNVPLTAEAYNGMNNRTEPANLQFDPYFGG